MAGTVVDFHAGRRRLPPAENEKTMLKPPFSTLIDLNKATMAIAAESLRKHLGKREALAFLSEIRRAMEKMDV